jgi:NADH dehydrogenase FAD-containing subunit
MGRGNLGQCTLAASGRAAHLFIGGGGLEGMETLGEVLRRHRTAPRCGRSSSRGERLVPEGPPAVDAPVRRPCPAYAVGIVTGARVTAVESDAVVLAEATQLAAAARQADANRTPPS